MRASSSRRVSRSQIAVALLLLAAALPPTATAAPLATPALFTWTPALPQENAPVRFTLPDAVLLDAETVAWTFGDGATSSEARPLHAFPDLGTFNVTVRVQHEGGRVTTASAPVLVVDRPCGDRWRIAHETPALAAFRAAAFSPDGRGFAVGDDGAGLRFDGQRWTSAALPARDHVDVASPANGVAYAVASDGAISRFSSNAWSAMVSPALSLSAVAAAGSAAYAGGDALYVLGAGGTWSPVVVKGLSGRIVDLELFTATSGLLATDTGDLWRLDGTTWTFVATAPVSLVGMDARSVTDVVAASREALLRYDGAWHVTPLPGGALVDVAADGAEAYAIGRDVWRLDGTSWALLARPPVETTFTGLGMRAGDAWLFSSDLVLQYRGGGYDAYAVGPADVLAVATRGADAWAVDAKGRAYRHDGSGFELAQILGADTLTALAFAPDGTGYAADDKGRVYPFVDGRFAPPVAIADRAIRDVAWSGASWFAVGDGGLLLQKRDATWVPLPTGVTTTLRALAFQSPDVGILVGDAGRVLLWRGVVVPIQTGTLAALHDVAYLEPGVAWVVGDQRALKVSGDAVAFSQPVSSKLFRGVAARGADLWAVGMGGALYRHSAGRLIEQATLLPRDLHDVAFAGETGVAVGAQGSFLAFQSVRCLTAAYDAPALVEGEAATLAERAVASQGDTVTSAQWTFGDGTTSTLRAPAKTWAEDGTFLVTLRVWDDDGLSVATSRWLNVADVHPLPAMGAVPPIREGEPATLDGAPSRGANAADVLKRLEWDWSYDGKRFDVDATGPSPTWTPGGDGPRTIALRAWDEDSSATLAALVDIVDSIPDAVAPLPITVNACLFANLTAEASKAPSSDPIVDVDWDYDYDGSFEEDLTGESVQAWCEDVGRHTVALRVTDADGSTSLDVTEIDVLPRVAVEAPPPARAAPGEWTSVVFRVTNLAAEPASATVMVAAPNGVELEYEENLSLPGDSWVDVEVEAFVPQGAPGNAEFELRLDVQIDLCAAIGGNETLVIVDPVHKIALTVLGPHERVVDLATGEESAAYPLRLTNLGNVPEDVDLVVTADPGWPATLDAGALRLAPGAAAPLTLTVHRPVASGASPFATAIVVGTTRSSPAATATAVTETTYDFRYALLPRMNALTLVLQSPGLSKASEVASSIEAQTGIRVAQVSRFDPNEQRYVAWREGGPSFTDLAVAPGDALRVYLRPDDPDWAGRSSVEWRIEGSPLATVASTLPRLDGVELGWASVAALSASGYAEALEAATGIAIREVWRWDTDRQDWRKFVVDGALNDFALRLGEAYRVLPHLDDTDWGSDARKDFAYDAWSGFAGSDPAPPTARLWRHPLWDALAPDTVLDEEAEP